MSKGPRIRWLVIPTWLKAVPVAALFVGLSILQYQALEAHPSLRPVVQELFFLPLFMCSLLFGLKGGLGAAAIISLNLAPLLMSKQAHEDMFVLEAGLQIGVYFLSGALTGLLVDRERREAARVKKAEHMALLGQAAAVVAHELKSPLVAIGGFAKRMQKQTPADDPHAHMLGIIVEQTAHMERLLLEMLDYSRPLDLHLDEVSLAKLVSDCLALMADQAREAGVSLEQDPADDGEIVLDEGRVRQAVLNLVQNALHASPPGAAVRVSTRRKDDAALIEVRDQGHGIAPENLERVFQPFFTTKPHGTGLGLAIVRKIVDAHGGGLDLQSRPGQGSSFTLRLPLGERRHGPEGP